MSKDTRRRRACIAVADRARIGALIAALSLVVVAACGDETLIDPNVPTRLAFLPSSLSMAPDARSAVAVRFENDAGVMVPPPGPVTFLSRDTSMVRVDATGILTAGRMGQTWVVARALVGTRTLTDSVPVTVVCTADLTVALTPRTTTLRVGEQVTARIRYFACAGRVELTDTVTWSARDTTVARVDAATGVITGRAPGTTGVFAVGRTYRTPFALTVTVVAAGG